MMTGIRATLAAVVGAVCLCTAPPATDFYVATTGLDANDCLSAATACATLHVAAAQAALAGPQVGGVQRIHVAAGGYNEGANFNANTNLVAVIGAGSDKTFFNNVPGSCGTIIANEDSHISLTGMKISGVADPCTNTIYAQLGGKINIDSDVVLGTAYGAQLHCEGPGSQVQSWGMLRVSGSANNFGSAASHCQVGWNPVPGIGVTFDEGISYPGGLFYVMVNASIYIPHNMTWVGRVAGIAYNATANATIWTDGNGCNSLPATLPGILSHNGDCS